MFEKIKEKRLLKLRKNNDVALSLFNLKLKNVDVKNIFVSRNEPHTFKEYGNNTLLVYGFFESKIVPNNYEWHVKGYDFECASSYNMYKGCEPSHNARVTELLHIKENSNFCGYFKFIFYDLNFNDLDLFSYEDEQKIQDLENKMKEICSKKIENELTLNCQWKLSSDTFNTNNGSFAWLNSIIDNAVFILNNGSVEYSLLTEKMQDFVPYYEDLQEWVFNNVNNTKYIPRLNEISLIANFEIIGNIVNYFLNGGDLLVNNIKLIHKLNYKNELEKLENS